MASNFQRISEINSSKSNWNIKAKVIRMWVVSDFNRNTLPFSVEMVLMDDEGGRNHCSLRKTLLYKFQNEIKEGQVYAFENLDVATNGGTFKTTNHEYKLNFQFGSKVVLLAATTVRGCNFNFVSISNINSGSHDQDYLVDVIGMLTAVGEERQYERNGQQVKLNVIELEADGHKIQCTLFGSYVDDLNNFLASGDTQNAVVSIMLAKVKMFQDKLHIQNCLGCTKISFNPTIDDAVSLRHRMVENLESPTPLSVTQIAAQPRADPAEEFIYATPRSTIMGLLNSSQDGLYVVLGTITQILNPENWSYSACVCNKSVYPDSGMFFCEKCNKHIKNAFQRFNIKVRVMDDTCSATFVIFDRDATLLFNKTCADVLHACDKRGSTSGLPAEIAALLNCTYLFKVECKVAVNSRFEPSFRVRKICTDMVIINQFKAKWAHEEALFLKNANEITSLSGLVDSNDAGTSSILNKQVEPLTASSVRGKEIKLDDDTKTGHDLVPSFSSVVVDLDEIPSPKTVDVKNKRENIIDGKGKRVSPTADKEEDMNMPLKLLKRSIKIEKL